MEGFGINTNILETNVLNLAVVIGVLFVLGKDILTSNLEQRKNLIVQSLDAVELRYVNAQNELAKAKASLEEAIQKKEEIRQKKSVNLATIKNLNSFRLEPELKRLRATKTSTIRVAKKKTVRDLKTRISRNAIEKARITLRKERPTIVQKKFIEYILRMVFVAEQRRLFQ